MAGAKPQGTAWRRRQKSVAEQMIDDQNERVRTAKGHKAAAPPVQRASLPSDADFNTKLAALRHSVESKGIKWNGPMGRGSVLELILFQSHETNEQFKGLVEIIKALQKQVAGMQVKLDHAEKHLMKFGGDFQAALTYHSGALVQNKGHLFLAMQTIPPGKSEPGRNGGGWVLVI